MRSSPLRRILTTSSRPFLGSRSTATGRLSSAMPRARRRRVSRFFPKTAGRRWRTYFSRRYRRVRGAGGEERQQDIGLLERRLSPRQVQGAEAAGEEEAGGRDLFHVLRIVAKPGNAGARANSLGGERQVRSAPRLGVSRRLHAGQGALHKSRPFWRGKGGVG